MKHRMMIAALCALASGAADADVPNAMTVSGQEATGRSAAAVLVEREGRPAARAGRPAGQDLSRGGATPEVPGACRRPDGPGFCPRPPVVAIPEEDLLPLTPAEALGIALAAFEAEPGCIVQRADVRPVSRRWAGHAPVTLAYGTGAARSDASGGQGLIGGADVLATIASGGTGGHAEGRFLGGSSFSASDEGPAAPLSAPAGPEVVPLPPALALMAAAFAALALVRRRRV